MERVREGAAWIYRMLITLFTAAVVVEIFLAGLGVFRAMPSQGGSVSHETVEDGFSAHTMLGDVLGGGSILLVILILLAWPGRRAIGATVGLAVLTFVQGFLAATGEDSPVSGAFHTVNALLILALSSFLTWQAWLGKLAVTEAPVRENPVTSEVPER